MLEIIYSYVCLGIAIAYGVFLASFLALKRKKRSITAQLCFWIPFFTYFVLYEFAMYFHGDKIWFVAGLLEIAALMCVVVFNNEGCFWRNFCIVVLEQNIVTVVLCVLTLPFPILRELLSSISSFVPMSIFYTSMIALVFMPISYLISAIILRKIFRKEYEGTGTIYKWIMIGYIIISYISLASRWKMIDMMRTGAMSKQESFLTWAIWVVGIFVLCNYVPYVYNKSEIKRKKKEQKLLEQLLAESSRHYASLTELPVMLGQPLSGKITLDAVISEYARKAKEQGIMFDIVVEPLAQTKMQEVDLAVVADYLLTQAFCNVGLGEDAFVQLHIENKKGSIIFDVAYTGKAKQQKKHKTELFDLVIQKYAGTTIRKKKAGEIQQSVLLPRQEKLAS